MININKGIRDLIDYAIEKKLIDRRDKIYGINRLLEVLKLDTYEEPKEIKDSSKTVEDILEDFRIWAVNNNKVEDDSIEELDLFDTKIMSCLTKMPSEIERGFWLRYNELPEDATNYYYDFAKHSNYIREKRIAKDIKWFYESSYGNLEITINMSKPEKDPKTIAKSKGMKSSNYPKCLICKENEGYAGRINHPARGNHRLIEVELNKEEWFLQYSPYVYYNEHCIVLKGKHDPMKITKDTFRRLLEFVEIFPHYFIGSNADLPIVGGSILTHDHFQGGRYNFAMTDAKEANPMELSNGVIAYTLKWPLSVIRLKGKDIDDLVETANNVLLNWKVYRDESVDIIYESKGEPHNTITPIARYRGGLYELDLVLRNNRTTEGRPYGLFHPREKYHHIKKENIGLIEVMGLAVLPSRLKKEMEGIKKHILQEDLDGIKSDNDLSKHYNFAVEIHGKYKLNEENIEEIIEKEIGRVFQGVLKDAGVFKDTEEGNAAFKKCREKLLNI